MRQVFVFGCGKLFFEKQSTILKEYEIIGIYDNFKVGEYKLKNGVVVSISLPTVENVNNYPIVIMMMDYIGAWNQLYKLGAKSELIIFPYMFKPFCILENQLFSNGEKLEIKENIVYYRNRWNQIYSIDNQRALNGLVKIQERNLIDGSAIIQGCQLQPMNRTFGFSRGTPIDRYYIEKFLNEEKVHIKGNVLEVAEDTYTRRYGHDVIKSYMLHVSSEEARYIKGNFETGEGIEAEVMDCMILTQVLPFIFDCNAAISNIYRMLRKGGTCLLTVNGISQISRYDMERWGHFWQFTNLSLQRLLEKEVPKDKISIRIYGNVKTATAMLYGISAEELSQNELDYIDEDYQVLICAVIRK